MVVNLGGRFPPAQVIKSVPQENQANIVPGLELKGTFGRSVPTTNQSQTPIILKQILTDRPCSRLLCRQKLPSTRLGYTTSTVHFESTYGMIGPSFRTIFRRRPSSRSIHWPCRDWLMFSAQCLRSPVVTVRKRRFGKTVTSSEKTKNLSKKSFS